MVVNSVSQGPKYYMVCNLVDKNMKDKLKEISLLDAIDDLENRVIRFKDIIKRDFPGVIAEVALESDINKIESSRLRYNLYYIIHAKKRIKDFKWMIRNRIKFHKYNNLQLFNLILLKERLSQENALPF
jgi:hypothetical protein